MEKREQLIQRGDHRIIEPEPYYRGSYHRDDYRQEKRGAKKASSSYFLIK
jgi:hypothetical protein